MTFEQVNRAILESDPKHDWILTESRDFTRAIFKQDVNLRIEHSHENPTDSHLDYFREDWANRHPDRSASSDYYNVRYNSTEICSVILVHVDGSRGLLPIPELKTKTPKLFDYRVAQIVDLMGSLDEYMGRSGLVSP